MNYFLMISLLHNAHAGLIVKGGRAEGHLIEVAVSEQGRPEKVWKDQLGHLG